MLGPMFGDWGALLVQFLITAVVVLGLVAVVYWLVRRYSGAGLGRIGRGRVPRLAIVDAMSVDGRRRLVLVRRDNVEHLILIGGPADVVVEQAIQRQRRPKTAGGSEAESAPPPEPEEIRAAPVALAAPAAQIRRNPVALQNGADSGTADAGRGFSFRRTTPTPPANQSLPPARRDDPPPAPSAARFVDIQRPTQIEAGSSAPADDQSEPLFPELPTADLPPEPDDLMPPPPAPNGSGVHPVRFDEARPQPKATPSPYAKPEPENGGRSGNLAELENEMARLLGEITQKRTS